MAYTRIVWVDHSVQHQRTYKVTRNENDTITLTPAPGEIAQQGTEMNAENFNHMEIGIKEAHEQLAELQAAHNLFYTVTQAQMREAADASATLTVAGWTGAGPYTQTVNITGMTADKKVFVGLASTASAAQAEAAAKALLLATGQDAGTITVTAYLAKPATDIPIVIREVA